MVCEIVRIWTSVLIGKNSILINSVVRIAKLIAKYFDVEVPGLLQMTRFKNKATHVIFILLDFGLCSDRVEREVSVGKRWRDDETAELNQSV